LLKISKFKKKRQKISLWFFIKF